MKKVFSILMTAALLASCGTNTTSEMKPEMKMVELTNSKGTSVWLQNVGAGIASVIYPDRDGNLTDIVLGYKDQASYVGDDGCLGKIPGRFANRIGKGQFTLDGKSYQLNLNNGENTLHGGPNGFANKIWDCKTYGKNKAVFTMTSPDGDENYPSELNVTATYTLSEDDVITLDLQAETDGATIVNLTNHTYWNLRGENSGTILDQNLQINAANWLPTDEGQIPTGEIASVEGTPMDFRTAKPIGRDIEADFEALKIGKGYDHCWVVDGDARTMRQAVVLSDSLTGRRLEVWSDQPGVQVYSGNYLAGSPISKSGRSYGFREGIAIESQDFPDAINHENFPSPVLRKGEKYHRVIEFRLSVE